MTQSGHNKCGVKKSHFLSPGCHKSDCYLDVTSLYRSGPSKSWIKVKNPKAPAAIRILDGTF
jgi:hypothetical protein